VKFDNWQGTDEQGRRVKEEVERTTMSQGSRDDARGAVSSMRYESYEEEWTALIKRKIEIQQETTAYSKTKMAAVREDIRRRFPGHKGAAKWTRTADEMQERRRALTAELTRIEARLVEIKPRVKVANERETDEKYKARSNEVVVVLNKILAVLNRIERHLERGEANNGREADRRPEG
jgi:hypothetical protein